MKSKSKKYLSQSDLAKLKIKKEKVGV